MQNRLKKHYVDLVVNKGLRRKNKTTSILIQNKNNIVTVSVSDLDRIIVKRVISLRFLPRYVHSFCAYFDIDALSKKTNLS